MPVDGDAAIRKRRDSAGDAMATSTTSAVPVETMARPGRR